LTFTVIYHLLSTVLLPPHSPRTSSLMNTNAVAVSPLSKAVAAETFGSTREMPWMVRARSAVR
jgi:hypothetical protein